MLTTVGKSLLFLTLHAPLFFIFYMRQYDRIREFDPNSGLLILAIGVITTAVLVVLAYSIFHEYAKIRGQKIKLDGRRESVEKETLLYFITYIIPFVSIGTGIWTDIFSYTLIFGIIYIIYLRSSLIYLNPLLTLLGFKTYKISTVQKNIILITKKRYRGSVSAEVVEIEDGVYYEPRR